MKISAKGRYGLAAMIYMAEQAKQDAYITIIHISEQLGISKVYLEQTFSLLKRAGLVTSIKGAQGGYQLARMPMQITAFDVLSAIEISLFEKTDETVGKNSPDIEAAMQLSAFEPLGRAVETTLKQISLYDLVNEAEKHKKDTSYMFYI
ncbi:Rrf2 family transcriptional regulator [Hydrogenoanaerobacterium sp.]|uniref:RrF2 family transcriptional regulator n=1 Tax=Hydrogenoanaerobacterium sp. TaxID=2953763 RepID=UPI002897115E|nr:Rrf2 family transcriptional regulator [Hydrogenoanaerobacterium sp.]